ncbi:MAG: hypothetical protein AB7E73_15800 [Burkholderiales bacterium]
MKHLFLLWSIAGLLSAGSALARDLVEAVRGELPVIIAAPHGGRDDVPGCDLRTPTGARFVTATDFNTDVLARGIAAELERLTGKKPYLVVARFHRKFIDANRRAEEAYGSPGCRADYEHYHAVVRGYVDEVRAKHPHAVLFDIHGQAAYRDSILRGTRHGVAVSRLLARAGPPAVTGPDSVFGRFAAMGYAVIPPNDTSPLDRVEARNYTGGHTVDLYGSHRADGIDTMQLEFGRDFRGSGIVEQTARDTARAIHAFHDRFLKPAASDPRPR